MAKKPAKKPHPEITRPVQWKDLTKEGRQATQGIMREHGASMEGKMRSQAEGLRGQADRNVSGGEKTQRLKANRLDRAAEQVSGLPPLTHDVAARNRVEYVKRAATDLRLPDETIGGAGWYFEAHGEIAKAAPREPRDRAITASSMLSPGTNPVNERRALGALSDAQHKGEVNLAGRRVPFSEIPTQDVPKVMRGKGKKRSRGVRWGDLGGPHVANIAKALGVLRGETPVEKAQSPTGAPKTTSYTEDIRMAEPDTPQHNEYMLRAGHLGRVIRGEEAVGQGMLDLFGERESNEGILSNEANTAEDTWMQSISRNLPGRREMKAVGDVGMSKKTFVNRVGRRVAAHPSPQVGPAAVQHAWQNKATQQAATMLQDEYKTDFTVPSVLVQETAWTGIRRWARTAQSSGEKGASADKQYNATRSQAAKTEKNWKAHEAKYGQVVKRK